MRSSKLAAIIAMTVVSACGGGGYTDDYDTQTDEDNVGASKDGGVADARAKDASTKADGGTDAGGRGTGAGDDDGDDASDEDGDDTDATADAGAADAGKVDPGKADAGGSACATLTYETFGKQFLSNYCVSCHGASGANANIRLDTLAAATMRKAGIKAQVLGGSMPLGNKLPSDAERTRFGQWIDCGPK